MHINFTLLPEQRGHVFVAVRCIEVLLIKDPLCTRFESFMPSQSTQRPLFYRFLEMENKFCCISTATVFLLLPPVQYPDSVFCLSPLALTGTKWDLGLG